MRLSNDEHIAYTNLIASKLESFEIFSKLSNDEKMFDSIGSQLESRDPNHNHSFYLTRYNAYVKYINDALNEDVEKFKKLQLIADECSKVDVSSSFIELLKSEFKLFNTRDEKAIELSLINYHESRKTYNVSTYWSAVDLLNKDLVNKIRILTKPLSSLFVFEKIKTILSNMVIIGANGSGKSRFSRQIAHSRNSMSPISIIPAQHLLGFDEFTNMEGVDFSEIIQNYDAVDKIGSTNFNTVKEDFANLIKHLQVNYNKCARKERKKDSVFYKVSRIFEELIKSRKVVFNDDLNMPMASTLDGHQYSINEMSDGEKAILYFIVHIINAKPNSFIVIDEPENHLHYDACISLWNKLENERKGCTFLYLSHSIDFVLSRKDSTFIWNKSFIFPDEWDIEIIDNVELPKRVYLEILGTVPPILYCEGESDSLDKEVYSAIFPSFLIKECGGCNVVKQYKISIQNLKLEENKKIYAIVDKDLKSLSEISKCYTKYGINVLKVLEVENLLFVPEIASLLFGERFDEFKNEYFRLCSRQKDIMINERLKYVLQHRLSDIKSKSFMEKYRANKNVRFTLANVQKERLAIEKSFKPIFASCDYMKALKTFDLKNSLFDLADRFVPDYKNKAVSCLKSNRSLCKLISHNYIGIDL